MTGDRTGVEEPGAARRPAAAGTLASGGVHLDLAARRVVVDGEPVELPRREFDLLAHLVANPGRAFSRDELLEQVWASSAEWQSPRTVTEHVRRLRAKVEPDPTRPARIVSVRGVGYRFDPSPGQGPPAAAPEPEPELPRLAPRSGDAYLLVRRSLVLHASPAALRLLGAPDPEHVLGRDVFELFAPESVPVAKSLRSAFLAGGAPRPDVVRLACPDGSVLPAEMAVTAVRWQGRPATQLTLWDLRGDTDRVRQLAIGVRSDVTEAVVVTDRDLRIQSFNPAAEELYGWSEDEVIGTILTEAVPPAGGASTVDIWRGLRRTGRWHGVLVQRRRDGAPVAVRASVTLLHGRAAWPVGVVFVNRRIDEGRAVPAAPGTTGARAHARGDEDAAVVDLRRAIEQGELEVHYQPVVDLADGAVSGAEAVVRWRHPARGILEPAAFIDVAERSGLIVDLGAVVLEEACRQVAAWRSTGPGLHVSVNVSARQLADPYLLDRLTVALERSGLDGDAVWLELTETALVEDLDVASDVLHRLAALGVRTSIDDFGTGWSSLTYLREFPIGSLKIDRVFVHGMGANRADDAIVTSVLSLAGELGLRTVAEGVETDWQRRRLVERGCALGQGYLFGRPQPPSRLTF